MSLSAPLIADIRRNSLDDGPGVRSVVFFKGCPLRCVWCQNPEAMSPGPQLQLEPSRCLGCRACEEACPGAPWGGGQPAADPCRLCGACVDACPAVARRIAGREARSAEIVESLLRDEVFYRRSGGGVTLSGGEPTLFPELAGEIAALLRARGVHVLLETCGHLDWERFASYLLPHLSAIYFDVKIADESEHRLRTGVGNRRILENLGRLASEWKGDLLPRVPLVPGITDTEQNLRGIAAVLRARGLRRVALLPYNPLWVAKRRGLRMDVPYSCETWMERDEIAQCMGIMSDEGLDLS